MKILAFAASLRRASLNRKLVALAAEIADGWLPVFFSPKRVGVFRKSLDEGFARRVDGKTLAEFDIAPTVSVVVGDDVDACRMHVKPNLALWNQPTSHPNIFRAIRVFYMVASSVRSSGNYRVSRTAWDI